MNTKCLTNKTWNQHQSWYNERLFEIEGVRYRTHIRRNAYDFQSDALVHRFDGEKWHQIVNIEAPLWPEDVLAISYVQSGVEAATFDRLVKALLDELLLLLGLPNQTPAQHQPITQ